MYQQIVVYTGDLSTRMDFDRLCISVCKTSVVNEKCRYLFRKLSLKSEMTKANLLWNNMHQDNRE